MNTEAIQKWILIVVEVFLIVVTILHLRAERKTSNKNTPLLNIIVPFVDNLLTFLVILSFAFILYNKTQNNSWNYIILIPISFTLKLYWHTLTLPNEQRIIIQFVLIVALALSFMVFYLMGKLKDEQRVNNSPSLLGIIVLTFGSGIGYGVSITASIIKSKK